VPARHASVDRPLHAFCPMLHGSVELSLLQLVEAGNAEGLSFKAPRAGFHYLLAATLASDTIHDAGVTGEFPLGLF